jgi:hypothetical protein
MKWALIVAIAAVALVVAVRAAEPGTARGGASDLIQLKAIRTPADAAAVGPGDQIVMSCPKCKTISVSFPKTAVKKGEPTSVAGEKHLCPGCAAKIETKGHGKDKVATFVHRCTKCGSKDVMCCVLKAQGGSTQGMEAK